MDQPSTTNNSMSHHLSNHISSHFRSALEHGYIQVYYQPVIRTISRKLCSFEALARWMDPELGMIRPDQFIPVLENDQVIHLLDVYVIEQVCARIRETVDEGDVPVPVSVNLSRLDFTLCDIFSEVDRAVSQYKIPHDFLYIEITESMMAEHKVLMQNIVDRFRDHGFQVWMDDFGSAYSSLNILKDFSFDELKLDMQFLSSFTQRSRRILASIIQMAKEINIKTLAEGVETQEQVRFLRNIGCEKVQGYYFGKPMPYENAMEHLQSMDIPVEKPQERKYYDDIGKINLLSAVPFMSQEERDTLTTARQLNSIPLAIAEGRGDSFCVLFYNSAFKATAREIGIVANIFTQDLLRKPQPFSILPSRFFDLMDSTRTLGEGHMQFISNEEYYEIHTKCIAKTKEAYSILLSLSNLSKAGKTTSTDSLDEGLRQLYTLFERITLFDPANDTIHRLYVAANEDMLSGRTGIRKLAIEYAQNWIFSDDREKYLEFFDYDHWEEMMQDCGRTFLSALFRTFTRHGQFHWKQYTILRYRPGIYLELIRDVHDEAMNFIQTYNDVHPQADTTAQELSETVLWRNLTGSSLIRLFWKDLDRRFLGVSKAFLDYYGFDSAEAVLGKTDEDLGWHVRPDHYKGDEEQVIEEGITTHNIPGRCMSNGENREILASKGPLYNENGEIRGLIGYFIDRELLTINDTRGTETKKRDQLTGLLNSRGVAEEAVTFRDEYYLRNADFVRIHVSIDDFGSINRQYGFDFGDKAISLLGRELNKAFGITAAVGRYTGHQFVILHQVKDQEEVAALRSRIKAIASGIRQIDGVPVTFYLSVGYTLYSETESLDEQAKKTEIRLLADHSLHDTAETIASKASDIFHLYDDLPISYSVYKVLTDENGGVYDAELFYVNHTFERRAGIHASELLGRSTRQLFPAMEEHWYEMLRMAALDGETFVDKLYYRPTDRWYIMTISQVIHAGYCCVTYQEIEDLNSLT